MKKFLIQGQLNYKYIKISFEPEKIQLEINYILIYYKKKLKFLRD